MTQVVTPSITAGQVGKMTDSLTALCRKNQESLPSSIVQQVLEDEGAELAVEQFKALRTRVERRSELIVRPFKLDRTRTVQQMITALGRPEYIDKNVLATMPSDGPDEGELFFFPGKRNLPVPELAAVFDSYGLVPHPYAQMQISIDDPSFADEHPNGSQWQDANGRFCYLSIVGWRGERNVGVNRFDGHWDDSWWFAGVRKPAVPAGE